MVSFQWYWKLRSESDISLQLHNNSLTQHLLATNLPGRATQETVVLLVAVLLLSLEVGWLRSTDWNAGDKNQLSPLFHITSPCRVPSFLNSSWALVECCYSWVSPAELLLSLLPSRHSCSSALVHTYFLMNLAYLGIWDVPEIQYFCNHDFSVWYIHQHSLSLFFVLTPFFFFPLISSW